MPRKRKGERADGRIQIQLDVGYDATGKRVRKYFYGKTRAEAETKKAAYLQQADGICDNPILLSEWIETFLNVYPSRANPIYNAQNIVPYNRLKTALGARLLASIREADLQRFINSLSHYSASTISKQMQVTKAVFAKARKNKLIKDDPAEDLTAPKGTKGEHRALTQGEVKTIVDNWSTIYSGLWIMIMLFAGLRRSEMMALDWSNVDMRERTLTVKQVGVLLNNRMIVQQRTKTSAGTRIIPISAPLFQALATVPPDRRTGFICLSARSEPLSETAIRRGVEQAIKKLGVSFRCHDLRHTFCTMLYNGGVDVKTAAYLMGHSDVSVTMKIYTHLSEEKRLSSSAQMLDFFGKISQ